MLSCADALAPGVGGGGEELLAEHMYLEYLLLWRTLFDKPKRIKELLTKSEWRELHTILYDLIITGIVRLAENLDLSVVSKSTAEPKDTAAPPSGEEAPVAALQAQKPKDFQLFVNLVSFSLDLLPSLPSKYFSRWVYVFGRSIMSLSSRHPLVSGFYKLFALCLNLAERTGYFEARSADGATEAAAATVSSREVEACRTMFRKFLGEVSARLHQFKDDLLVRDPCLRNIVTNPPQASCLRLFLSAPKELISLEEVIVPLQMTFSLGLSFLPLAYVGVECA